MKRNFEGLEQPLLWKCLPWNFSRPFELMIQGDGCWAERYGSLKFQGVAGNSSWVDLNGYLLCNMSQTNPSVEEWSGSKYTGPSEAPACCCRSARRR